MKIKDFIPPIILKAIKIIIDTKKNNIGIDIEYNSYESAKIKCINGAYQNIELCEMIADKTIALRDSLSNQTNTLNSNHLFLLSAINYIIITHSLKSITILDFGGSCGAHFFEIKRFLPETFQIKWIVVETPQMVLTAKTKNIETQELTFQDNMNNLPHIDFIYSSGALQYTSKPYEFLDALLKIGANHILFNRMCFNENDREIITILKSQLSANGPGPMPKKYTDKTISYPQTTLSYNKFTSIILKKYKSTWIFNESSETYKIGNEPIIGRGLFYTFSDVNAKKKN